MKQQAITIGTIPAIVWGEPTDRVYLYVHGKMSNKESAHMLAEIAQSKGWQVVSFDLPQHGQRQHEPEVCDIWNGIRDVQAAADYVYARWQRVALYGCSLGAFFSLHALAERKLEGCLFLSPVVDMDYLIGQMFLWFGVTEAQLAQRQEIATPIDTLSWPYYQYVKAHPITHWPVPTHILYGGKDNLQSRKIIEDFAQRFSCNLTVSEDSEHPFMAENDMEIVGNWLKDSIE